MPIITLIAVSIPLENVQLDKQLITPGLGGPINQPRFASNWCEFRACCESIHSRHKILSESCVARPPLCSDCHRSTVRSNYRVLLGRENWNKSTHAAHVLASPCSALRAFAVLGGHHSSRPRGLSSSSMVAHRMPAHTRRL